VSSIKPTPPSLGEAPGDVLFQPANPAEMQKRGDLVTLEVGGVDIVGWTEATVMRSMDHMTSSFSFAATGGDANRGTTVLAPGTSCRVRIGDDLLVTGYIDSTTISYSANDHRIQVDGRSKTKDLVDCSAPPGWAGRNLMQCTGMTVIDIIKTLVEPFGINVVVSGAEADATQLVPDIQTDADGATVGSILQDLCDRYAIWLSDTPEGDLALVANIGQKTGNALSMKPYDFVNTMTGEVRRDESNTFSSVTVRGQGSGTDENFGRDVSQVTATVTDGSVKRYRPLILPGATDMTQRDAKSMAVKERQSRLASSFEAEYTVHGWRGSAGELWRENRIVEVADELLGIHQPLLVFSVQYTISEGGTLAALRLILPESKERVNADAIPDVIPEWTEPSGTARAAA
jgi:prophage tail gpP-like protein